MFKSLKTSLAVAAICAFTVIASACGSSGSAPAAPAAAENHATAASSAAATAAQELSGEYGVVDAPVEDGGAGSAMSSEDALAEAKETDESDAPVKSVRDDRKIVWHAQMSLETLEFDKALAQLEHMIKEKGGYIETQSVDGGSISYQGDYYKRSASITARIPSGKLDSFSNGVESVCNVVSRSKSCEDITDSYFDASARLETLKIQEERLLEILKKAEKLEDVITLEGELSKVRYEIEKLTAAIRRMDSQTAFSYMNLELSEVAQYKPVTNVPKTFGEELSIAASRSGQHFGNTLRTLTLVLVECLPILLLWGAIILGVVLLVRAIRRRLHARGERKNEKIKAKAAVKQQEPEKDLPIDDKK